MTLTQIIEMLKTSGINSKQKVIKMLETKNTAELYELQRSINSRIGEIEWNSSKKEEVKKMRKITIKKIQIDV